MTHELTRRSWLQFAGALLSAVCGVWPTSEKRLTVKAGERVRIVRHLQFNRDGTPKHWVQQAFLIVDVNHNGKPTYKRGTSLGHVGKKENITIERGGTLELGSFTSVGEVTIEREGTLLCESGNAFCSTLVMSNEG